MRCPNCNFEGFKSKQNCSNCKFPYKKNSRVGADDPDTDMMTRSSHIFDLHRYELKFKILKSNSDFKIGQKINMGSWSYYQVNTDKYKIQIKPRCIQVFLKKRFKTADPETTEVEIINSVIQDIKEFADKYNIVIDPAPIPLNKEVKIEDLRMMENFRCKNYKSVYPIPSPLEFTNPRTAVKDSVKFISHIDRIENALVKWSDEYQKHAQVLDQMSKTLIAIENQQKKPSLLQRLKNFIYKSNKYIL